MGLQEQISQVQEVCRESLGALREALLSLDERVATDGKEVSYIPHGIPSTYVWLSSTGGTHSTRSL